LQFKEAEQDVILDWFQHQWHFVLILIPATNLRRINLQRTTGLAKRALPEHGNLLFVPDDLSNSIPDCFCGMLISKFGIYRLIVV
jgi:hypothetical protein